jgi:hypothetical protein
MMRSIHIFITDEILRLHLNVLKIMVTTCIECFNIKRKLHFAQNKFFYKLSHNRVTIDGVWIGHWIY